MSWDPGFEVAFNPRTVAIVGASGSYDVRLQGGSFVRNFQRLGFPGKIYPINPNAKEVFGLKAYPDLASVPEPIDLVIVSIPAPETLRVLEDCITAGARNVHIYTAGFSETGEEGRQIEEKVREIAQRGGLRLVGPNCMGINVPAARMLPMHGVPIDSGPVAFLSQSGGHCVQFTRYARGFGIGFSKAISYGNATIMDSTDFLEYLATDPETKIITMYLEGVRDGRKLTRLVREINHKKPVIVWKGGLTESGAGAVASHTGALAGGQAIWDAFFKQTGAVQVNSLDELADMTMTFLYFVPPQGRRVALFMGGGGHSVTMADFCAREGLEVPILAPEVRRQLRDFIPVAGTSIRNPIDAENVLRDVTLFEKALKLVAADPQVDVLIVNLHLDVLREVGPDKIGKMGELMCSFATNDSSQKPLVAVLETWGGDPAVRSERSRLQTELTRTGIGVYRTLPRACRALAKFIRYHKFQREALIE